jgi:hypothetical protein
MGVRIDTSQVHRHNAVRLDSSLCRGTTFLISLGRAAVNSICDNKRRPCMHNRDRCHLCLSIQIIILCLPHASSCRIVPLEEYGLRLALRVHSGCCSSRDDWDRLTLNAVRWLAAGKTTVRMATPMEDWSQTTLPNVKKVRHRLLSYRIVVVSCGYPSSEGMSGWRPGRCSSE